MGRLTDMTRSRFQSTLSVRRATDAPAGNARNQAISIHALRKESDLKLSATSRMAV